MNSVSMARRPVSAALRASSAVTTPNLVVRAGVACSAPPDYPPPHMRQQEAEQEAARRNVEDERRDRFVFYALDHSAGLGDYAWEVEMRLRSTEDAVPEAVAVAAGPPQPA